MKIEQHFITSLSSGGAQKVLLQLMIQRASMKESQLYVYYLRDGLYRGLLEQVQGIKLVKLTFINVLRLILFEKEEKNEILMMSWLYHADFICLLVKVFRPNKFWISNVRNGNLGKNSSKSSKLIFLILRKLIRFFVDDIIYCGDSVKAYHVAKGYPDGLGSVIYNSVPSDKIIDLKTISNRPYIIGFLGRYSDQKGIPILIDCFHDLYAMDSRFKLRLAGQHLCYENRRLTTLLSERSLLSSIELLGELTDVREFFTEIDILISPSLYGEGFPNSIAEAVVNGVPVIATNVGDTKLIVDDFGAVVDYITALKVTTKKYISQWDKRNIQNGARRARSRILTEFSSQEMFKKYELVMKKCAD